MCHAASIAQVAMVGVLALLQSTARAQMWREIYLHCNFNPSRGNSLIEGMPPIPGLGKDTGSRPSTKVFVVWFSTRK